MSEEDAWDAEDFDPEAGFSKGGEDKDSEAWEGEDEGLVIEEDKEEVKSKPVTVKKSKQERIEEKKAKRREEELKNKPKEPAALTEEEKLAEKRRVEDAQRTSDLQSAMELFGVSGSSGLLDRMNPSTPEEFEEFQQALSKKITQFEAHTHYTSFLESFFRSLCTSLDTEDLRRLSSTIGAMATEKQKLKQPHAKKKKGKNVLSNTGKASRKVAIDTYDDDLGPDFDDFM